MVLQNAVDFVMVVAESLDLKEEVVVVFLVTELAVGVAEVVAFEDLECY